MEQRIIFEAVPVSSGELPGKNTVVMVNGYIRADRVFIRKELSKPQNKWFIGFFNESGSHLSSFEVGHEELNHILWQRPVNLSDLIKEEAGKFAEWIKKNKYQPVMDMWWDSFIGSEYKTTEDLYAEYLAYNQQQSSKKQQS